MKRNVIRFGTLACAILAASVFTGCGGSKKAAATTTASKSTKAAFSVCGGGEDAMVINTAKVGTLEGASACRHLYEGLYKLDKNGKIVLGQASDVKVSDDGLTYTFTIRKDTTWSDGIPVTAKDFVFGWKYLKDSAGDYSSLLSMINDAEASADNTLVVKLAYKCSYLPSVLSFPPSYPVRQDIAEKYGDQYATDPEKAVYNGPYEVSSWTHQESLVMTARPDYYDAAEITAGKITWELMTEASTMLASFKSGDLIYSDSYPEEEADSLKDNGLHFASGYNTYCAIFNVSDSGNPVLKDARVRQALSLSIDRDRLISIRNMNDELATTYAPSGLTNDKGTEFNSTVTPWYDQSAYKDNCEKAKQLLADAGYKDGTGFPALTYIVSSASRKTIAESVINDWKEVLGITSITVETVNSFYSERESKNYDIAYYGWYMDYPDISNMMYTFVSGINDSGYNNPDYDAAYNAAISETDQTKQWKSYDECESILAKDAPVAPFFHSQNSYLFDSTSYDGLVYYCGTFYFGFVTKK